MQQLSFNEIIKYAEQLELDSYYFYKNALDFVDDLAVKELISKLAEAEIDHFNRLKVLSGDNDSCDWKSEKNILVKKSLLADLEAGNAIDAESNFNQVVKIALNKEKSAEELYSVLLSLTDLADDSYQLFSDLKEQEIKHAEIIKRLIL